MTPPARLDEKAAAFLLGTAALFDLIFVFFLLQLCGSLFAAILEQVSPDTVRSMAQMQSEIRYALELFFAFVSYLVLLLLYWLVCELVLSGKTLGRLCMMLSPRRTDGSKPSAVQMGARAIRKIRSLGLTGLSLSGSDSYDRATGVVWFSPMAARQESPTRNWRFRILSGRNAGQSLTLGRMRNFVDGREIRIGRDAAWADVLLDQDGMVSSRHAVIHLRAGRWYLTDYGGGTGSTHGTFVNGSKVPKRRRVDFPISANLRVANVELKIERSN